MKKCLMTLNSSIHKVLYQYFFFAPLKICLAENEV